MGGVTNTLGFISRGQRCQPPRSLSLTKASEPTELYYYVPTYAAAFFFLSVSADRGVHYASVLAYMLISTVDFEMEIGRIGLDRGPYMGQNSAGEECALIFSFFAL